MIVRLAVTSVALVAATTSAHADRKEATLGSIHVELRSGIDIALTVGADGAIATARAMPQIWIAPLAEPCGPHERAHQLPVPHDYRTTTRPIPEPPFARGGDALCIDGEGGALAIAISPFDPRDPAAQGFVREILESLAALIRPDVELVPGVIVRRRDRDRWIRRGALANQILRDGYELTMTIDQARCPVAQEDLVCGEALERAVVVRIQDVEPDEPSTLDVVHRRRVDAVNDFARSLITTATSHYGAAMWAPPRYRPRWGTGDLTFSRLPRGAWKVTEDKDRLVLFDVDSRSRLTLELAPDCALPAGERIRRPAFFPSGEAAVTAEPAGPWRATACFELQDVGLRGTLELPRPPDDATQRAFAAALAEDPSAFRGRVAVLAGIGRRGGMFAVDGWVVDGVSLIGELGVFGGEGDQEAGLRFGLGGGVGISRPAYRAGIHLGVSLERPPLAMGHDEDLAGGSLFLDGRAMVKLGKLGLEGSGRAAYHFDVDCPSTQNRDELCGSGGTHDDFEALFSFEAQGRLMFAIKDWKIAGFVGVRHLVATTRHLGTEQSTFASAGIVFQ